MDAAVEHACSPTPRSNSDFNVHAAHFEILNYFCNRLLVHWWYTEISWCNCRFLALSVDAQDLLKGMLCFDPSQRLTGTGVGGSLCSSLILHNTLC